MENFEQTLEKFGADLAAVRSFDTDAPELLRYATLIAARQGGDSELAALTAVYEWQNDPLVFLVDGDRLTGNHELHRIRRLVAMRGDAPYLGVIRPGQLTVYRVSLDHHSLQRTRIDLGSVADATQGTFPHLCNQRPGVAHRQRNWISKVVLNLLSASIDELKTKLNVLDDDAISLVGRALFTRFLADRELLPNSLFSGGSKEAATVFDDATKAAATSRWLDDTFNGDFLPLSPGLFRALPPGAFATLGDILRRAPGGQLFLGWEEKWNYLDFSHIPVGVLSEAYEHYLREHAPVRQRKEGGYYTPRIITDIMVRGAFHALRRDGMAHKARVLDAAAGAGVFLITTFRELVSERWRHDRVRPDTKVLREILHGQITGFDINESALRFAALGLYLMAIELDPSPEPVQKLRFDNLRGTVLHNVGEDSGDSPSRSLGSLGSRIIKQHSGRYDLVIGNPPWSSGTRLPNWAHVVERVSRIAHLRCARLPAPKLPNEVLDLPFLWRAMDWAKTGGQIALALHARLLFQQGEGMPEARSAVFAALNVTGIVNGAEVRHTKVWPEIAAPFCLLFARNELPPPGAAFRFVSPRLEDPLNSAGAWRVDVSNAELVSTDQVILRTEILKTLFRGSSLDLEVLDRLKSERLTTLEEYWRKTFGEYRGRPRFTGNGYQRLRESSRTRRRGDGNPGVPASYLWNMPEITPEAMESPLIDISNLPSFQLPRIHDPRSRELFRAPILIVHEAPPARRSRIRTSVADEDVIFNQSYHGYAAKEHPKGRLLVRYLALLLGSRLALWYSLVTSGRFGFERDVVEKITIDRIPILPFEYLDQTDYRRIEELFERVKLESSDRSWASVDVWVGSLYGLRDRDLQVIDDTLRFNLPFSRTRNAAQAPASRSDVDAFCTALRSELEPWAQRSGKAIQVVSLSLPAGSPWSAVQVSSGPAPIGAPKDDEWSKVFPIADRVAATEIVYPLAGVGCLWLLRLKNARYWSRSQARLAARRIVWEHVDLLFDSPHQ